MGGAAAAVRVWQLDQLAVDLVLDEPVHVVIALVVPHPLQAQAARDEVASVGHQRWQAAHQRRGHSVDGQSAGLAAARHLRGQLHGKVVAGRLVVMHARAAACVPPAADVAADEADPERVVRAAHLAARPALRVVVGDMPAHLPKVGMQLRRRRRGLEALIAVRQAHTRVVPGMMSPTSGAGTRSGMCDRTRW